MVEPKLVKGWLGWAAIGYGLMVYAPTKAEALRRFRAATLAESPPAPPESPLPVVREDVMAAKDLAVHTEQS